MEIVLKNISVIYKLKIIINEYKSNNINNHVIHCNQGKIYLQVYKDYNSPNFTNSKLIL